MEYRMLRRALGAAAFASAAALGAQQAAPAQPPGNVPSEVTQWKGVVIGVDVQARVIDVDGPHGTPHQFSVPQSVTNLSNVKKGDTVTVNFVESIVVYLRNAADAPVEAPPEKVTVTPAALPDLTEVKVKIVMCEVTAVDLARRTISFTTAGKSYNFKVAPGVQGFSTTNVGDQLELRYTESTAITVTK